MKKTFTLSVLIFSAYMYCGNKVADLIKLHETTIALQSDAIEQSIKSAEMNVDRKNNNNATFSYNMLEQLLNEADSRNDMADFNCLLSLYAMAHTAPKW